MKAIDSAAADPRNRSQFSAFLQYAYFFRFSFLFWLTLPTLAIFDWLTGLSALTRGIFTPSVPSGIGACYFFVICQCMVCLLTARIACIEGAKRFLTDPPSLLRKALGDQSERWGWRMLLIAQLPGLFVMYRYHANAHMEGVIVTGSPLRELFWSTLGIGGAILFWRFVNDWYYWDASVRSIAPPVLLWPKSMVAQPRYMAAVNPWALGPARWFFNRVASIGDGYRDLQGSLLSTHRFAIVGAATYLMLYAVLAPLTAPVEHLYLTRVVFFCFGIIAALVAVSIATAKGGFEARRSILFSLSLMVVIAGGVIAVSFWRGHAIFWLPDFPVISAVSVLLTIFTFLFTGASFFADRHRIPVLTTVLFLIAGSQWLFHHFVSGEHYFNAVVMNKTVPAVTPEQIYKNYRTRVCHDQPSCPIIVVTATGGGIQAAAWTQTVLSELELALARDCKSYPFSFHDHLLLLSSVSGGSVGSLPFLREYYSEHPFDNHQTPSITGNLSAKGTVVARADSVPCHVFEEPVWSGQGRRAAFCSSLGGVGWGLEYTDLLRIVAPFLPFQSRLTDRSAALEQSLKRNLTSEACDERFGKDKLGNESIEGLTLATMMRDQMSDRHHPAFSFNATVAESGGRFLLSNYENAIPQHSALGVRPAASWLDTYATTDVRNLDLNYVTAARLSATFPYISSAARVRVEELPRAQHFIDGGYFDNDGIATAVEFLQQIFLHEEAASTPKQPCSEPCSASRAAEINNQLDEILFIEIRDGADISDSQSDERLELASPSDQSWNPGSQLTAPILGFWRAGHSTVTRRNRRELQLLMQDLETRKLAHFHHLVFDYQKPTRRKNRESQLQADARSATEMFKDPTRHEAADPLSWHLTPQQKEDIKTSFGVLDFCVARVTTWAENPSAVPNASLPRDGRVECNHDLSVRRDPNAAWVMGHTIPASH